MKHLPLIALLAIMPVAASASVILETTGQVMQTVDSATGGSFHEVDLPEFDKTLGTLTGVTIDITASVSSSVTDYLGTMGPRTSVPATINLSFISATPISFPKQTLQVISDGREASAVASFSGNFVPSSLASFTTTNDNFFIPEPATFIQSLAGPDTESVDAITFDITETLTYTAVPEPGSMALLALPVCIMAGLLRRRAAHVVQSS